MHHRQEWVEIRLRLPQITLATLILEFNFKTTKIRILSHDFKVLLFSFMCLVYFTIKDIIKKNLKNISKSRPPPSHPSPSPEFGKYRPSCKNCSYKQTGVFIGKPCRSSVSQRNLRQTNILSAVHLILTVMPHLKVKIKFGTKKLKCDANKISCWIKTGTIPFEYFYSNGSPL